jgi:hypothetical protein
MNVVNLPLVDKIKRSKRTITRNCLFAVLNIARFCLTCCLAFSLIVRQSMFYAAHLGGAKSFTRLRFVRSGWVAFSLQVNSVAVRMDLLPPAR